VANHSAFFTPSCAERSSRGGGGPGQRRKSAPGSHAPV
ncbi:MAG: hypothetical protein AVDCRST_MAG78-541, partial [uncultured Rubrobacteraceae bacterium]